MPIALAGYYFLPDVPEISRARYFNDEVKPGVLAQSTHCVY